MTARTSMPLRLPAVSLLLVTLGAFAGTAPGRAPVAPNLLSGLVWRNLGPFRGGRISAVSGAIGQPGVFYIGLPLGGVWKTTSVGETWSPIFDDVTAASSVGALEVAPSDANVIYVGMGDLIAGGGINEGNGVYKSVDAGKTWQHLGLDGTRQIPSILVDPRDPNLVLIAAQGDVHKKSETRGAFRSTDGGKTWTKTLYVDDSTGLQKLAWASDHPEIMLATSVRHYVVPVTGPARVPAAGGGGGTQTGPTQTKLFKSTDKGLTWHEISGGGLPRLAGRTSVAVAMNTNAQRMFIIGNFGLYRSDDGGATWRQMDAADKRIANGQGGYNCGVYVDPKNPDVVYTSGSGILKITYPSEQWINVSPNVDPALYGRTTISQPLAFAPWNQHELITGFQFVMATTDGGMHWTKLSPDLGYPKDVTPPPDSVRGRGEPGSIIGGAIQSLALSPVRRGVIWAGTNNGLIKLTTDEGKTWTDVTIPDLPIPGRADILAIEASHFDAATAYVAADLHQTGDYKPYFFRTHNYGKTWTSIVNGLATDQPSGSFARVIRQDTKQAGLLFAGTESVMYVSFDDG